MPTIEAGLFFIMLGLAIAFTFVSFKMQPQVKIGLRLLSMALFMILAVFISSGYQISMTHTSDQTIRNIQTNETWVEGDSDSFVVLSGGTNSYWFAWVLASFAFINLIFMVREIGFEVK
jgi:hypothetical protein